jgi:hypothetical protein
VGLSVQAGSVSIWTNPKRRNLPTFEASAVPPQWVIGYSYFGGLADWTTHLGTFKSHSPIKLSTSKPYWVLAADSMYKMNGTWADRHVAQTDPRYFIYANCPPHMKGTQPAGGNQVYADGSAGWKNFDSWYRLTSWAGAYGQTFVYWSQEPTDFEQTLLIRLPQLK